MPRAILSVSDKSHLVEFARTLVTMGWDLIASGGTAAQLQSEGVPVSPVEVITGAPEMLGGRVKTLHPAIHAGILARDTDGDLADLNAHGYAPISMVICNLYPFQSTVRRADISLAEAIEQIDIGGVTLLRAAAKNFVRVTVICDPLDYSRISAELASHGEVSPELRQELAVKAFAHTRDYDTAIHAYLQSELEPAPTPENPLPGALYLSLVRTAELRYGENPQQAAAFYAREPAGRPLHAEYLGKGALSYNNILDLDAAWNAASTWDSPVVVLVNHRSPTGIASSRTIAHALPPALASDRAAALGGVIAVNRPVDEAFVAELADLFVAAIAAPDFTEQAVLTLQSTRQNCRLLKMLPLPPARLASQIRSVRGGFLLEAADQGDPDPLPWRTVTHWKPSPEETDTLRFAWQCVRFVPSTAVVLARPGATVAIAGGQPAPVDAVRLTLQKAGQKARGAVMAADCFISHPETVDLAVAAGVSAIIQPGGAVRDARVIEAADRAGIAMVFTGTRHQLH